MISLRHTCLFLFKWILILGACINLSEQTWKHKFESFPPVVNHYVTSDTLFVRKHYAKHKFKYIRKASMNTLWF